MHQKLAMLHEALKNEVPSHLSARVAEALTRARARRARFQHTIRVASGVLSLFSFAGLFYSVRLFIAAASASGFTTYASLFLSDSSVILTHMNLFVDGLAESIPGMEITLVLALVAVFLVSLRGAVMFGTQPRVTHMRTA